MTGPGIHDREVVRVAAVRAAIRDELARHGAAMERLTMELSGSQRPGTFRGPPAGEQAVTVKEAAVLVGMSVRNLRRLLDRMVADPAQPRWAVQAAQRGRWRVYPGRLRALIEAGELANHGQRRLNVSN